MYNLLLPRLYTFLWIKSLHVILWFDPDSEIFLSHLCWNIWNLNSCLSNIILSEHSKGDIKVECKKLAAVVTFYEDEMFHWIIFQCLSVCWKGFPMNGKNAQQWLQSLGLYYTLTSLNHNFRYKTKSQVSQRPLLNVWPHYKAPYHKKNLKENFDCLHTLSFLWTKVHSKSNTAKEKLFNSKDFVSTSFSN